MRSSRVLTAVAIFCGLVAQSEAVLAKCVGTDQVAKLRNDAPSALSAIETAADAVPYGEGRFYQVSKAGKNSWVFGTYHDAHPSVATIPEPVKDAIQQANRVLVEITDDETQAMSLSIMTDPTRIFDFAAPPMSERLGPEMAKVLEDLLPAYGLSMTEAERMRPWFLVMMLAQPPCALKLMSEGQPVLDAKIVAEAKANGVAVAGLETADEVLDAFVPDDPALELDMLRTTIATANEGEDYHATATRLYLAEDIQMIWEYAVHRTRQMLNAEETERMLKVFGDNLIVGRNLNWMPQIKTAVDEGQAVIAVGALHLPGEQGLLRLLEDAGYTVTRIPLSPT